MGYEDAVLASDFIECNTVVGCHFDTFPPVEIDHVQAQKAFGRQGEKNFIVTSVDKAYNITK